MAPASQATNTPTDLAALSRGPVAAAGTVDVPRPSRRWRTRVLVPTAVFVAAAALLLYSARGLLVRPTEVRVVPVVVKSVGLDGRQSAEGAASPVGPSVQAPGWIEPEPYAINVPALVDGVVRDILALEGDPVEKDQVVAHLVDDELRLAARSARAVVAERKAEQARALAGIEPMRAAVTIAQVERDTMKDEAERKRDLVAAGGISAGEFSRLEIRLRGAEARISQARSELAAAEAAAEQAGAGLETANALLAEAELRLSRCEVRSPASGVVLTRLASPGTRIAMTSRSAESGEMTPTLLRLYDPAHLQVRAEVPLKMAAMIAVGARAELTTEALVDQRFEGRVTRVVHEANIQRNSVQFKLTIERPSPLLKPEMQVRVRFNPGVTDRAAGNAESAGDSNFHLLLPSSVLVDLDGQRARAWVVEPGGSAGEYAAVLREVTLGGERDGEVVVLTGVRPGDRVISAPPASLRVGSLVRVVGETGVSKAPTDSQ